MFLTVTVSFKMNKKIGMRLDTDCILKKGVFIWRSIQYVGPLKALYTFCPPWQTCSFRHQLGFCGKHFSHAAITRNDQITHISNTVYIARYSFIQLSQQGRQWKERKCPIFETVAQRDSNPGSLDCEFGILPLGYRAPLNMRSLLCYYRVFNVYFFRDSDWLAVAECLGNLARLINAEIFGGKTI